MKILTTTNYAQFKKVTGNRDVDMSHVNRLIKLNAETNLMWQFPGTVTKDGYLWDGQHRLEASKAQGWPFYYTQSDKTLEELEKDSPGGLVGQTNISQLKWQPADFIKYYAERGNEQYMYLRQLTEEYHLPATYIVNLIFGHSRTKEIKRGTFTLYTIEEEKSFIHNLLSAYVELGEHIPSNIVQSTTFARVARVMLRHVTQAEIIRAVEKYGKELKRYSNEKDYFREFEDIINKGRHEGTRVRFY